MVGEIVPDESERTPHSEGHVMWLRHLATTLIEGRRRHGLSARGLENLTLYQLRLSQTELDLIKDCPWGECEQVLREQLATQASVR